MIERRTGRTYRALDRAVQEARQGKRVLFVVSDNANQHMLVQMLGDHFSNGLTMVRKSGYAVWAEYVGGGYVDFTTPHRIGIVRRGRSPVTEIWDHFAVECELARIDREIDKLRAEKAVLNALTVDPV